MAIPGCYWRYAPLVGLLLATMGAARMFAESAPPSITVWYGAQQQFGDPGMAQQWVNILGSVSDPDDVDSLTYSLNGGPQILLAPKYNTAGDVALGPDTRRLLDPGDFNIEIDVSDLLEGTNQLLITATDTTSTNASTSVLIEYTSDANRPESYSIDWSTVTDIQDVVQVVDGQWYIDSGGLRPVVLGYDRAVAVGDASWDDYEVRVPITMHSIDSNGFAWPSVSPGFGLTLRWPGHTAWDASQPRWGWEPVGAGAWYDAGQTGPLRLGGDDGLSVEDRTRILDYNVGYVFKMRVQTIPGQGSFYGLKVWEESQAEPLNWDLAGMERASDLASGSCVIVAHHVDLTIGNISIASLPDPNPPVISDIVVTPSATEATVTWRTDERATSSVAFGPTQAYENGATAEAALVRSHSITLAPLVAGRLYHFQITSVDVDSNARASVDFTFVAAEDSTGPVVTDLQVSIGDTSATIAWATDEPARSVIDYGLTTSYTDAQADSSYRTSHTLSLLNLAPNALYHYRITSTDISALTSTTGDFTFTTGSGAPLVSDDFNTPALDTAVWTFVDPHGDASLILTGTEAQIVIPATGRIHDVWTDGNFVPRLMQAAPDVDFEVETKFESTVTTEFQSQGILIEGDSGHLIRAEFHYYDGESKVYAATIAGQQVSVHVMCPLTLSTPMYLRVSRNGDRWTVSYSFNGADWTPAAVFTKPMTLTAAGVFAGNSADTPQTATIDYFFNAAAPVVPEDDCNGNGTDDAADVAGGISIDCNSNGYPDECELSIDCNGNGTLDECEIVGNDSNANATPDDCEVRNLTRGTVHTTIGGAMSGAADGDTLLAPPERFSLEPYIDYAGKAVALRSAAGVNQPVGATLIMGERAVLEAAENEDITLNGDLVVESAARAGFIADRFVLAMPGSFTVSDFAAADVDAVGAQLAGTVQIEPQATLAFSGTVTNTGTVSIGGGLLAATVLTNSGGSGLLAGFGSVASDITNDARVIIHADSLVMGDYTNDGSTVVQDGTLRISGSLTGSGAMVGGAPGSTRRSDPPRTGGDRLFVAGSYHGGAGAALAMSSPGLVVKLRGNFDAAIDSNARYDMASAALHMLGTNGAQTLEAMSADVGPSMSGLDRTQAGHYPVGTLRIGPTPTTVRIVDNHDNDGRGQASPESVFAHTFIIDAGATLITGSHKIYYVTLVNNGNVDELDNLIRITTRPGDCDLDGDLDDQDYAAFAECYAGPSAAPPSSSAIGCGCRQTFDFDGDSDIDLIDFATFQQRFQK